MLVICRTLERASWLKKVYLEQAPAKNWAVRQAHARPIMGAHVVFKRLVSYRDTLNTTMAIPPAARGNSAPDWQSRMPA